MGRIVQTIKLTGVLLSLLFTIVELSVLIADFSHRYPTLQSSLHSWSSAAVMGSRIAYLRQLVCCVKYFSH
ncbi:hypothetical protein EDD18DRAFT_1202436 [Armillaria luteobubalina]|uniref:Uncharacterized protein n=1 Tax=Armillaria luteobubalina TaxID=153913 RepID=A0AA39UAE1_9AGAR|nr:hypothetical protein EDD18DRAFT_1202436 [Armillaria luteobubalina]